DAFFGFLSAVAFATILAVVAGLALAGASALSHDLYVGVIKKGIATEREQVVVARVGTITLGVLAVLLGIVFENQNVAYLVGLAFAVAADVRGLAEVLDGGRGRQHGGRPDARDRPHHPGTRRLGEGPP